MFEFLAWSAIKKLIPTKTLIIAGSAFVVVVSAYLWHLWSVHTAVKEAEANLRITYSRQFQLARKLANESLEAKNKGLQTADEKHRDDLHKALSRVERETEERVRDAEERGRKMGTANLPLGCFTDRAKLAGRVRP